MKCPKCSSTESEVKDSRPHQDWIRRRRKCHGCGHLFTTYERVAPEAETLKPESVSRLRALVIEMLKITGDVTTPPPTTLSPGHSQDQRPPFGERRA